MPAIWPSRIFGLRNGLRTGLLLFPLLAYTEKTVTETTVQDDYFEHMERFCRVLEPIIDDLKSKGSWEILDK